MKQSHSSTFCLIQFKRFIDKCATVFNLNQYISSAAVRYLKSSAKVHSNCDDLPSIPEGVEAPTPWSNVP